MKINRNPMTLTREDLGKKFIYLKAEPVNPIEAIMALFSGQPVMDNSPLEGKICTIVDFVKFSDKYETPNIKKAKEEAIKETGRDFFPGLQFSLEDAKSLGYYNMWRQSFAKEDAMILTGGMKIILQELDEIENPLKDYIKEEVLFKMKIEEANVAHVGQKVCLKTLADHNTLTEHLGFNYHLLVNVPAEIIDYEDMMEICKDVAKSEPELQKTADEIERTNPGFKAVLLYDDEILSKVPYFPNVRKMKEKHPFLKQLGSKTFLTLPRGSEIGVYDF